MPVPHSDLDYDVVVVGSGCAGLQAALAAHDVLASQNAGRSDVSVLIATNRNLGASNSALAQGGLQHVDGPDAHDALINDMVRSGGGPPSVDRSLVERFAGEVGERVAEVIALGLMLDRDENGELRKRTAGAMSSPRVVTARGRIGPPLLKILMGQVRESEIDVAENVSVASIEPYGDAFRIESSSRTLVAGSVVCATGGTAWRRGADDRSVSSNPRNDNHLLSDYLTRSLGLQVTEPDAFQYQPYGDLASVTDGVGKLIPESLAVAGPKLVDRLGNSVVDLSLGRLAVTSAMWDAISADRGIVTEHGIGLRLTLSEVTDDLVQQDYPAVHRRLRGREHHDGDVIVAPFLHYQLGGVTFSTDCQSSQPGLFVAGEITGGLHGANRLMGNGITDALVHGRRAGVGAAERSALLW